MAMQPEAWMTHFLFSNWITHFVNYLSTRGGISRERRHLLVVDGHNSHVTLNVVMKAMDVGLDLLTLPSHTTHRLQPLDVSIFAPFKKYFRRYRDAWVMKNRGRAACKEILAMWVSLGLQRALISSNIQAGFRGTSIWPLNPGMVEKYLGPAQAFEHADAGDLRRSPEGTTSHLSAQVGERSFAAGSTANIGTSSSHAWEPSDGGDTGDGPDEALVALLQERVLDRPSSRQYFVVRSAELTTALGRRSPSPSSDSGTDADAPHSPRSSPIDAADESAPASR